MDGDQVVSIASHSEIAPKGLAEISNTGNYTIHLCMAFYHDKKLNCLRWCPKISRYSLSVNIDRKRSPIVGPGMLMGIYCKFYASNYVELSSLKSVERLMLSYPLRPIISMNMPLSREKRKFARIPNVYF